MDRFWQGGSELPVVPTPCRETVSCDRMGAKCVGLVEWRSWGKVPVSILHDFERELENGPQLSIVEKVEKLEKTAEMNLFKSFEIK